MGDTPAALQPLSGKLLELSKLVNPSEVIDPSDSNYLANTQPWSTGKDLKPQLVLRPTTVESLSSIVTFLAGTDLNYKVRSQGYGSASASDVLISLSAFDDFEFNEDEEYVMLGSGGTWRAYYDRMQAAAPDWTIVCARTPAIGIGGSTLCSGFSWLSSQYGCVSDPANMLDVYVVTADGRHFWASSDPDLLWSMRGTESGFAIATKFKFRARRFPENGKLWAGAIMVPRIQVDDVLKGVIAMAESDKRGELSDKTAMFLYVARQEMLASIGATGDMLVIHAFDARGEAAGREAFKWALEMKNALDFTTANMTLKEVAALQEGIGTLRGTSEVWWSPICLAGEEAITEDIVFKAVSWWTSLLEEPNSIAQNPWLLLELYSCRDNLTGRHSSAWPRPVGFKNMMLLGSGCAPDSSKELRDKAKRYVADAPRSIFGKSTNDIAIMPNALEDFHDVEKIYGEHYQKLRQVKARVDPKDKLKGWIRPL